MSAEIEVTEQESPAEYQQVRMNFNPSEVINHEERHTTGAEAQENVRVSREPMRSIPRGDEFVSRKEHKFTEVESLTDESLEILDSTPEVAEALLQSKGIKPPDSEAIEELEKFVNSAAKVSSGK